MLKIATIDQRADAPPPALGLFSWYYIDLCDHEGNGLVLIWSRGLPFLAQSRAQSPGQFRHSLHMVTYLGGRTHQYLLQELPNDEVEFDEATGNARFGRSRFTVTRTERETLVHVDLDIDLPERDQRWAGHIDLAGPSVTLPESFSPASHSHFWCPISVHAAGHARIVSRDSTFTLDGSGYFDSNSSSAPIDAGGLVRWDWGRVRFPQKTLVYYILQGSPSQPREAFLLLFDERGTELTRSAELIQSETSLSRYAVRTPRKIEVNWQSQRYQLALQQPMDLSPFYERYLIRATGPEGEVGVGIGEVVLPGRIDRPWMRPFLRMKTHHVRGSNSMWLPLFSGANGTPWSRLWDSVWGARHVD